jgi:alkanesulfonate monooxygenase SsuD/methylene tetrahydromethanopterin reductase-like flavin-dependent oxidoreductase (luciferase family)
MTDHRFRFGIIAGQLDSPVGWTDIARRLEGQGFDMLLVPDTLNTLEPLVACAAAAAATSTLHVGPYVLSAPNRTPGMVAHQAASLQAVTGGRFELGIGTGRPGAERDAASFGMPFGTPGQRVVQLSATVAAVRERSPEARIMVAAGGPRMLRLAGALADTVTFGLPPTAGPDALAAAVAAVRDGAGQRTDAVELAQNLLVVGDQAPEWTLRWSGTDLADLVGSGAVSVVPGSTTQIADELRRRRDTYGISYVCTSAAFADVLAPVAESLAGS